MKKFLTLTLLFVSAVIFVPSAQAKTANSDTNSAVEANQQRRNGYYQRQRRIRIVNRTRIVRSGYRVYREVIQYRYFPNGRVQTRLISRTRIR